MEGRGFEPPTSGVRFQRSPTELAPHDGYLGYTGHWSLVHFAQNFALLGANPDSQKGTRVLLVPCEMGRVWWRSRKLDETYDRGPSRWLVSALPWLVWQPMLP